jgi:hypothetical protein
MTPAELHVTKCRLCGQPPTGREGLCADCSRALFRAREGSAALRKAPAADSRKSRAIDRIVLTSPTVSEALRVPDRGRLVLWAVIGVVAIALVLVGTAGLSPPRTAESQVSARVARPPVSPLIEPGSENQATEDETFATPGHPKGALETESPMPKEPARAQTTRAARSASSLPGARSSTGNAKSSDENSGANGSTFTGADTEPPMQLARSSAAPTPSSGDDGQGLASALEKCGEEKFLAGVICEQKARLRFCEGKWGKVPQCTAKPRVD